MLLQVNQMICTIKLMKECRLAVIFNRQNMCLISLF